MTVWLPCVGASELLRVVSSAPYSQAATGVRRDICGVAGPVRPQPATMTPAALSVSAGCCETDPTGVAIGQLPQGSVMYFSGSLSDSPRRLTELTKEGYLASRTLLETSRSSATCVQYTSFRNPVDRRTEFHWGSPRDNVDKSLGHAKDR